MDNLIGKRLDGRYEIAELIGVGGMANVYRANDLSINRIVAVKVLRDEFLDNEELVRRFKNESKAIALLSHPNIVKVFDVNFSDAVQYIVMEYIDGITLKQYIDVQKPLSWKDTVHFTTQILRALQHAHDRGIVHRDIKPQNIMLLADGSIKVMDFGIARFSRSETRTITDKAIGSVHYISPEQARGDITDAKADIYSVGIMMYEMLTGTLPFESDTPVQVAIKQISDNARRPREIVQDIPEGLEEITLKAMTKDPGRRYQSASQMLRDIDDFKKNPSIVFEYKYFTDPDPTRYVDKARVDDGKTASLKSAKTSGKKGGKKKKDGSISRTNLMMYTVMGVTAAVVICTLVLSMFSLGFFDGDHEEIVMPNLVGQVGREVMSSASYSFKFRESDDSDYNADYPEGYIYRQNPMPGMPVKDNAKVELYISKGTKIITLPDVTDWSSGDAVEQLRSLGVQVQMISVKNENYASNIVIKMEPDAGEQVPAGSLVILSVNMLSEGSSVAVPDLNERLREDALADLSKVGLTVGKQTLQPSNAPAGTVIGQDPAAGSRVSSGTKVDIIISSGAPTLTHTLVLKLPAPPQGATSYTLRIAVNGTDVHTSGITAANNNWTYPLTIDAPSTITVYFNGVLYATYSANNTDAASLTLVSGGGNWSWPTTMYAVNVSVTGAGTPGVSPTGSVPYGEMVTISPTPTGSSTTYSIAVNGTVVSTDAPYIVQNVQGDLNIVITFS